MGAVREISQVFALAVPHTEARRIVRRLLDSGEVLERRNPIGGISIVLGTAGCARLLRAGFDAKPGYETSSLQAGFCTGR